MINFAYSRLTGCFTKKITTMLHADITGKIIGAAMEVHNTLGNGFQEVIYQRALAIEMTNLGLSFEREKEIPVNYKGIIIGRRRADFFVEGLIMVELKAVHRTPSRPSCSGNELLRSIPHEDRSFNKFRWEKSQVPQSP